MGIFRCAISGAWIAAWTIIVLTTSCSLVTPFANAFLLPPLSSGGFFPKKTSGRSITYVLKSGPPPPPQGNIHGWDSHPSILLGYWNVSVHGPSSSADGMIEGELCGCFVLKKNGKLKAGGKTHNSTSLWPRGWTFTPANRRLLVETDVVPDSPYSDVKPMTLRYSFRMQQVPIVSRKGKGRITHRYRFAVGYGNVKVRPYDGTTLPSSKGQSSWARLRDVCIKRNVLAREICATHHNDPPLDYRELPI